MTMVQDHHSGTMYNLYNLQRASIPPYPYTPSILWKQMALWYSARLVA